MKTTRTVLGIIIMAMSPLIILTSTVYTLMLPNIYESTVRIAVQDDTGCESPCEHCANTSPEFIQTEMIVLQSKPILYEVVKRLDLQSEWGRGREKLPREVAYKILRNSLRISRMRDTLLVEISVRRDHPDEAADIANETAEVYRDYREQVRTKEAGKKIDALEVALKEQLKRVEQAEEVIQNLRVTLDISVNGKSDGLTDEQTRPFRDAQQNLESERFVYNQVKARHRSAVIDQKVPSPMVEMIDIAEPNRRPVSPNLFLNVLLSVAQALVMAIIGFFLFRSGRKA